MAETQSTITTPHGGVLQHATTITPDQASSVEIATDSKGTPKLTVKIYHEQPEEAARQALDLYRRLTAALSTGASLEVTR